MAEGGPYGSERPSVMIYSPCPVLTVTIERDRPAPELHLHAGGQGVWQARMLTNLGVRAVLCTTLGGEVGRVLESLLAAEAFEVRAVRSGAASGWYVHDRSEGRRIEVAGHPGGPLDRHEIDELGSVALTEGLRTGVSVFAGPTDPRLVTPGTYRRLAADLRGNEVRVVADLAGEHMTAAVAGGLDFLKVSHDELIAAGRARDDSLAQLRSAAVRLRAEGAAAVVVSRAEQPAVAVVEGSALLVEAPRMELADPRGAGDSMTAAAAAMLAQGAGIVDALRMGAAAGAANVTRHGLGTAHSSAVEELAKRVKLIPLPDLALAADGSPEEADDAHRPADGRGPLDPPADDSVDPPDFAYRPGSA
jgi:1-phosphofructokinase